MAKIDIENLLDGVRDFLIDNLNPQIAALDAEKNDGIVLKTVDETAYHLQYPQDRVELSDPFVVYDEAEEPVVQSNGGLTATLHRIGITLVLADNGMDLEIVRRLFRYRRLLQDLVQVYWSTMVGSHKFNIHAWTPTPPFKNMETGFTGRAVGVVLSVSITD